MKLVSVIVATYRRDVELKRALESLALQKYPKLEIVLIDDNGEPKWNTRVFAIVEAFKCSYPHIPFQYIINTPNLGSAETRNTGVRYAKGYYITFLDDDDIYLPDKVSTQTKYMEQHSLDYSITDLILYYENGKECDRRNRSYIKNTNVESLRMYHLKYHMTGTDTMMFRKDYLTQIGGFAPIDVGDEFYLMQRAIEGKGKFGYLPKCEIKAYVHTGENGLSSGESKIRGENALYEYKKGFFGSVNASTRRYIRMRHHAVLAFAYKRIGEYLKFIKHGVLSVLADPVSCASLVIGRKI